MESKLPKGVTPEILEAANVFDPYHLNRAVEVFGKQQRFVHYTSADSALAIARSKQLWLRKSSCMNDYRETEHGSDCLVTAYRRQRERFTRIFDPLFPGFGQRFEELFNGWMPHFKYETYIACMSEHDDSEDTLGRLSMWRAYGGRARVGLVLKSEPLVTPNDALGAHTYPVSYLSEQGFDEKFDSLLVRWENNIEKIREWGEPTARDGVFHVFRSLINCTKHPGFQEEREWRLVYTPKYEHSPHIIPDVISLDGVPQPIQKLPLKNIPESNLTGIEIPEILDRIIIGPTEFPAAIKQAFANVLEELGVENPSLRIHISDIPLRN